MYQKMKATVTKTKINSTNGQHYFRLKIYYGNGVKSKYLSLSDLKLWNRPSSVDQKKTNQLHKELIEGRIEALKRELSNKAYSNKSVDVKFFDHVGFVKKNRGSSSAKNMLTYNATELHLRNYCKQNDYSEDILVSDIDYDFSIGFKTHLKTTYSLRSKYSKLSPSSQNNYFVRFCVIMNDAVSRDIIIKAPTKDIEAPSIPDKEITYLTLKEIQLLHSTECDNDMLKKVFLFAFYTGLRKGDIERLRWNNLPIIDDNIDLDLVTGKKGVRLTFKLPQQAVELLPKRTSENDKVFMGFKYDGYQNERLRNWILKAGINKQNVGSHTARHSFAVYHLSKGTPMYTLSKLMAHNSVRTTERSYAQYEKEDLNLAQQTVFE